MCVHLKSRGRASRPDSREATSCRVGQPCAGLPCSSYWWVLIRRGEPVANSQESAGWLVVLAEAVRSFASRWLAGSVPSGVGKAMLCMRLAGRSEGEDAEDLGER